MPYRFGAILLLTLTCFPCAAAAQETRAEAVRAERQAKANQLQPPQRSKIEAILFKIEDDTLVTRVLAPPRGLYVRIGGIGEGAGFGGGPGYRYSNGHFDFSISAADTMVPPVSIMSSTMTQRLPRTSPITSRATATLVIPLGRTL